MGYYTNYMVWGASVISIVAVLATLWIPLGLSPITVFGRNKCKGAMQRRCWGLKVSVLYYSISKNDHQRRDEIACGVARASHTGNWIPRLAASMLLFVCDAAWHVVLESSILTSTGQTALSALVGRHLHAHSAHEIQSRLDPDSRVSDLANQP